jgi:hypothetical protein
VSIRTTVTLDDDLIERIKQESRSRGSSFRNTLNDLLRTALLNNTNKPQRRTLKIKAHHMGYKNGLNHDDVESLLEFGEGEQHR